MDMKNPKMLIIVLFQNLKDEEPYYARTPAPPLPGILLAAMTPPIVEVEVLHEMVRPVDYDTDADFIAISFMDYLAPHVQHSIHRGCLRVQLRRCHSQTHSCPMLDGRGREHQRLFRRDAE
jgi:hypothetical protein